MPENIIPEPERLGKKALDRIAELEKTVKALVQGMKEAETATGEPLMPIGVYSGIAFEE